MVRHSALPGAFLRIPKIGHWSVLVTNTGHIICFYVMVCWLFAHCPV